MSDILKSRHTAEVLRALSNHRYENTDSGTLYMPQQKVFLGGAFKHSVNDKDVRYDPNIVPNAALSHFLRVVLGAGTQITAWYISPFSGNVTPGASLTAANYTSTCTEFTNFDESTRVLWAPDAEASQSISNTTTTADFTIGSGGGTIYGAAMLSVSTKSATTGTLIAASKFSAARVLLEDDVLKLEYTFTAADA